MSAEESLKKLEILNTDYDILLRQLEEDPGIIERIAPATLGMEPNEANTVYPKVTVEQLDAARKVLAKDLGQQPDTEVPKWIIRCSDPSKRIALFSAGAFLILISFICFSPSKRDLYKQ